MMTYAYMVNMKNFIEERRRMRMSLEIRAKLLIPGFSGGSVVKNPPANAENMGSIPDPRRSHMPRSK